MQGLSLQLKQKQQLHLSPEQINEIRLLELPSMELQQRVNEELQANPALEEGIDPIEQEKEQEEKELYGEEEDYVNPLQNDDFNYDEYVEDDETPDYKQGRMQNYSPDDDNRDEWTYSGGTTLMEYLKSQVYLTKMTKPERHIAKWVLGNIDAEGYLRRTTEQLVDDLYFQEGLQVPEEQMSEIVEQIKTFDPAGIASANLQECLSTQLKQKKETPAINNALRIVTFCFEEFSKRHYDRVQELLELTNDEMREAVTEIVHLNQKPANAFTGNILESKESVIVPDFYVEVNEEEINIALNTNDIPDLHVSQEYQQMAKEYSKAPDSDKGMKEALQFVNTKIGEAQWFIAAIQQRNETLYRIMVAIVDEQREFFQEGDEAYLKPMILQDIADKTGYDVSTVSRVTNNKFVQTEFGIYPLKHFFSEGMQNGDGEEVSTREIKKAMQEIIAKEDKSAPLSDEAIAAEMTKIGYPIARRTIAKYRELFGIPVARLRKQA